MDFRPRMEFMGPERLATEIGKLMDELYRRQAVENVLEEIEQCSHCKKLLAEETNRMDNSDWGDAWAGLRQKMIEATHLPQPHRSQK